MRNATDAMKESRVHDFLASVSVTIMCMLMRNANCLKK